jgi:putative DNA primase/helicase
MTVADYASGFQGKTIRIGEQCNSCEDLKKDLDKKDSCEDEMNNLDKKNAFKINFIFPKKLPEKIKNQLKKTYGCHWSNDDQNIKAFTGSLDLKYIVEAYLRDQGIKNFLLEDVFDKYYDFSKNKQKAADLEQAGTMVLQDGLRKGGLIKEFINCYNSSWKERSQNWNKDLTFDDINNTSKNELQKFLTTDDPAEKKQQLDHLAIIKDNCDQFNQIKHEARYLNETSNDLWLSEDPSGFFDYKYIKNLGKNEIGDAELFVEFYRDKYVFDPKESKNENIFVFNGRFWEQDQHKQRYIDFEEIAKIYELEAKRAEDQYKWEIDNLNKKDHVTEEDEKRIKNIEVYFRGLYGRCFQLRTNKRRSSVFETISSFLSFKHEWDCIISFLPCQNGIVDLKTGKLLEFKREQYIRKVSPISYNSESDCKKFKRFLKDITLGDEELENFLHRLLGYAILGIPKEERVFYFFGAGRNGKGTLMNVVQHVLGPLAKTFPSEMLLIQKNPPSSSAPNPEMANLAGIRLAVFSEINEGRKVDAAKVKNLSGQDIIPCRRLFSNADLQIRPTHTMILQTNFKPKADSDDFGLWSRNVLVPFNARFVKEPQKKNDYERPIKENLKNELIEEESPGILNWLIEGCLEYQRVGLQIPKCVINETEMYRIENDGIGCFLNQMCVQDPSFSTPCQRMIEAIQRYCQEERKEVPTRNAISTYLKGKFTCQKTNNGNIWKGISIKQCGTE